MVLKVVYGGDSLWYCCVKGRGGLVVVGIDVERKRVIEVVVLDWVFSVEVVFNPGAM